VAGPAGERSHKAEELGRPGPAQRAAQATGDRRIPAGPAWLTRARRGRQTVQFIRTLVTRPASQPEARLRPSTPHRGEESCRSVPCPPPARQGSNGSSGISPTPARCAAFTA
jgi:hypothetical protein